MAAPKRIIVEDATGDGAILRSLPAAVGRRLRPLATRTRSQREKRLMRVAARILPALQNLENVAIAEPQRLIAGRSFDACCEDSRCIERALTLFDVAWQTGLTELVPSPGAAPLSLGNGRTKLGACGLSVAETQQHFLKMAIRIILSETLEVYEKLRPFINEKSSLPRMRLLAGIDASLLAELQRGWGKRFEALLTDKDDTFVIAIKRMRPFQIRALRTVMGQKFTEVLDWSAEMVESVQEYFTVPEQFRDLGEFFVYLTSTEAVRAVGLWDKRDVTEKVNAERAAKGEKPLKGRRWETDISVIKRVLGAQFGKLLECRPTTIDLFGQLASSIYRLEGKERDQAVEQLQVLAKRYLDYLTPEMLQALIEPEPGEHLTMNEIVSVLEGLWMKNGLGHAFFEGPFQTAQGAEAVGALCRSYIDMKRRGSARDGTDIANLITGSDLFDSHIMPFLRKPKQKG